MKEIEKIGKVTLNKTFYSGTDTYSDGEIEDRLLEIVRKGGREDVLLDESEWALLYHLSPIRKNLLEWYDFEKGNRRVLSSYV